MYWVPLISCLLDGFELVEPGNLEIPRTNAARGQLYKMCRLSPARLPRRGKNSSSRWKTYDICSRLSIPTFGDEDNCLESPQEFEDVISKVVHMENCLQRRDGQEAWQILPWNYRPLLHTILHRGWLGQDHKGGVHQWHERCDLFQTCDCHGDCPNLLPAQK